MKRIALLGAGAMGSRVARNFVKAGYDVTVYNRSLRKLDGLKAEGVETANSPREAALNADIVIAMVRDNEASKSVWLGEDGAAQSIRDAIAIEMSTLTPDWVKTLGSEIERCGAPFLEAPVLGTLPQAEAGQLIYLVGGEEEILNRVRPVLQATSYVVHHIGVHGQAACMKLAVNAQYGVQVAIWAETLNLLEKQGIANESAVEILNTLPTSAPALQIAGSLIAAKKYMPMFPVDLVEKDFSYAQRVGDSVGLELPVIKTVHALYAKAKDNGFGGDNIVGVAQVYS